MTPRRRLLLLSLVVGVLAPSFARAQAVTYAFRSQEVANSSKATATGNTANLNQYAQFGIPAFLGTLAKDVTAKKCQLAPQVAGLFTTVVVPILQGAAKAGFLAGDATYGEGTIDLDLNKGVVEGGIITTAATSLQTSGMMTNIANDYENLGSQSLLCGGVSDNSGPGTCGAVCSSFGPNCAKEGGAPKLTGDSGGSGYAELFIYPLANSPQGLSLCTGAATRTWAECCRGDPNLVVIRNMHVTFSSDRSRIFGTLTNEEAAGTFDAQK